MIKMRIPKHPAHRRAVSDGLSARREGRRSHIQSRSARGEAWGGGRHGERGSVCTHVLGFWKKKKRKRIEVCMLRDDDDQY